MHSFKSYEKIGSETAPPLSRNEAPRQWRKKAEVVFLLMCSIVFIVGGFFVGIGFLRPTESQPQDGLNGIRSSDLIETLCNKTLYFEVCNSSLSAYPGALQANVWELLRMAVELSLDDVKRVTDFTLRLNGTSGGSRGALTDCVELLGDTADELNTSVSLLANANWRHRTEDVKTWLSAALTNPSTCIEGFEEVDADMQGNMKARLNYLTYLTSNALAILNYVSATEKVPNVSPNNRRLLTH